MLVKKRKEGGNKMKRTAIVVIVFLVIVLLVGCSSNALDKWHEDPVLSLLGKDKEDVQAESKGWLSLSSAIYPILPDHIGKNSVEFYSRDGLLVKAKGVVDKNWEILGIKSGMPRDKVERIMGKGKIPGSKEEMELMKTLLNMDARRYESTSNGKIVLDIFYFGDRAMFFDAYWAPH